MKPWVGVPFRAIDNATEAARAAAAAYADELQLPPLPTQLGGVAGVAWLLLCVAAAAAALVLLLRTYLDNGGLIPLSGRCVALWASGGSGRLPAATSLRRSCARRRDDTWAAACVARACGWPLRPHAPGRP